MASCALSYARNISANIHSCATDDVRQTYSILYNICHETLSLDWRWIVALSFCLKVREQKSLLWLEECDCLELDVGLRWPGSPDQRGTLADLVCDQRSERMLLRWHPRATEQWQLSRDLLHG